MREINDKMAQVAAEHRSIGFIGLALSEGMWVVAIQLKSGGAIKSPPCYDPGEALGMCYAVFLTQYSH